MDSDDNAQLQGIKGWLLLLAVCQAVGIFKLLFGSIRGLETYAAFADMPGVRIVIAAQATIDLGALALGLITFGALLSKKKSFLKWFFYQWIAIPVVFILEYGIVWAALGIPITDLLDSGDTRIAMIFLINGIWVLYTRKSKRVANTLVN
ncbi:MAG: hypothetical protein H6R00_1685 [Proteobacteria bacterium]|nr:hypothetical protein [Pseudomonadota bacterium]